MSRPSIALACIAKNERHNFPVLFDSIKGCFDEVHITDTGSTDGSIEYLTDLVKTGQDKEVLGCRLHLHFFEWCEDFSAARNFSFSHAKSDYLMWLDLDDSLSCKDSFILWRDTAMGLAEYWLATYNYAYDDQLQPICTFARERVVKNIIGQPLWSYFIHEGIRPQPGWRPQYATTWNIIHRRTAQDVIKDKGRNLRIFEKNKDKLDHRMLFYYGKELYEAGKPMEAFAPLMQAITKPELEMHDRILGIQYACYSSLQCNQPERAIDLAYQGLRLDSNRAEFWSVLGDAYLKAGNLKGSIPFFQAAKNCFNAAPPGAKYQGAVYNHATAYGSYPTEALTKIYYATADLDRAKREAQEGIEKYGSEKCKLILAEIEKGQALISPDKSKIVETDEIVFTTSPHGAYPWDSKIYKTKGLGGSETAAVEMATWLAKKTQHRIIVYNPRDSEFIDENGVCYRPIANVLEYFSKFKPQLHIAWRHNSKITEAKTLHWCHDLVLHGGEHGLSGDYVLALSEFHRDYLRSMQGIPKEKILLTRNGINPARFEDLRVKNPNKIIWPSSPDRGLERAIAIVEKARETHPDLELYCFYGMENLEKYGMGELAKKLRGLIAERPWVKYIGNVDQTRLAKEMMESVVWLYPASFIESFCITVLESVAAGCYPLVRKIGALQNTVKPFAEMGMATLLDLDASTDEQVKMWADELRKVIDQKKWQKITLSDEELSRYSWESVADDWINKFGLDKKSYPRLISSREAYEDHLDGVTAV
jgi:glycosyltransferase involved in cell wall biosynthesis